MKSILIVEDDPDVARSLADVLELEGFRATVASNGVEALERLRAGDRPDLILLDMMMPVMDGWEFRREQERLERPLAEIPVVVLTADGDPRRKAASIGAQGWLSKPTGIEELVDEILRVAGQVPSVTG